MKLFKLITISIFSLLCLSSASCSLVKMEYENYKVIETGPFTLKVDKNTNEAVIIDGDKFNEEMLCLKTNKFLKKYNIIGIGDYSFSYSVSNPIKKLVLSDSVKFVGKSNLQNCIEIEFNSNIKIFSAKVSLDLKQNISDIPSSLIYSSIGYCSDFVNEIDSPTNEYAFTEKIKYIGIEKISQNIKKIVLPENPTRVGFSPKIIDYLLENVELNHYNNGLYLGSNTNPYMLLVGVNDYSINEFKTHEDTIFINSAPFKNCTNLRTISYTGNVINPHGNFGTSSVEKVELADGIEIIGDGAFYNCTSLKEVIIPESVYYIKDQSFLGCSSLESINISNNVHSIGDNSFQKCVNLKKIDLPSITSGFSICEFAQCQKLKEIKIPYGVKSLYGIQNILSDNSTYSYFQECLSLQKVYIPSTVKEIDKNSFYLSKDLTIYLQHKKIPESFKNNWNSGNKIIINASE